MNIIFFGSDDFAVPSLKALLSTAHKISCVVTQPDRQKGRGLHLEGTPVKKIALESGLKLYQPASVNSGEAVAFLKSQNADLFIVIAYGQILSQEILDIPKIFAINLHASLLPIYRGAAPINWAIIKGDIVCGITVIKIIREMDAGPIIMQKEAGISPLDTAVTLGKKLSELGSGVLLDSLKEIENKTYKLTPQDEKEATLAPKLKKEDGLIDWEKSAQEINNLIRGCYDWPGAFTYYKDKLVKVYKARVGPCVRALPGEIVEVTKESITVAVGKDCLVIEELQIEGKRRMSAEEFIAGHKIMPGEKFGKK